MTVNYSNLNFRTRDINRAFRIKLYGFVDGLKVDRAVGVSGLIAAVGGDFKIVNSLIKRAFDSPSDRTVCRLRRGLIVTFYSR